MQQTAPRQQLSVRLMALIAAVASVFLLIGGAADAESSPPPTIEYVVEEGDSLWSIAAGHADPDTDIRNVIADIRQVSGLTTSTIYPGQILLIPQP